MKTLGSAVVVSALLAATLACGLPAPAASPRPPASADVTLAALGTEVAQHLTATASATDPAPTPAPAPEGLTPVIESIVIDQPAHNTTVTGGTVRITGFSEYVFESQLNVIICGEGGSGAPDALCGTADNVIARGLAMVQSPDIGLPGPFETEIPYTVPGPVSARILVYSLSARDGGLIHLASRVAVLAP